MNAPKRIRSQVSKAEALRRVEKTDPSWYPLILRTLAELAPNALVHAMDEAVEKNAAEMVAKYGPADGAR